MSLEQSAHTRRCIDLRGHLDVHWVVFIHLGIEVRPGYIHKEYHLSVWAVGIPHFLVLVGQLCGGMTEDHPQRLQWRGRGKYCLLTLESDLTSDEPAPDLGISVITFVGLNPPDGDGWLALTSQGLAHLPQRPHLLVLEVLKLSGPGLAAKLRVQWLAREVVDESLMSACPNFEHTWGVVLLACRVVYLGWVVVSVIGILHSAIVASVVQPDIIVSVDHDAASVGVELLVVLHPPVPRQVIPKADENSLAQFALEDRGPPRRLPVAQLVCATLGSAATTTLASASTVQLVQNILAVAHEARRLLHRFAVLSLLAQLALVGCDSGDSQVLQHLKDTWLIP